MKKKNKGGRPSKKKTIELDLMCILAEQGHTDKEMAYVLGICEATLNNYKKDKRFLESLKKGKEVADKKVVRSLFERATGYEHPEDKIFCSDGVVTTVPTTKHYPPDTTACIFWLKNRKSDEWKDKHDHNLNGTLKIVIDKEDENL